MIKTNRLANKVWRILEPPQTMGQRIRFWRLVQNWTQTRLAEEASKAARIRDGLSKSFVSLLEADRTKASVQTLHGMAAALGVTLDYLVTGETGRKRQIPDINLRPILRRAKEIQAYRIDAELARLRRKEAEV